MLKVASFAVQAAVVLVVAACSGKTERGVSSETAPADKPAAGPAQVDPVRPADVPKQPAAQPARHLLMVVELEPASRSARTLSAKPVELPLPRRRGRAPEEPWRVEVLSETGAVLYAAPLRNASEVRGEFPDQQGKLSGVTVQQAKAAVTLRLPLLEGARVVRVLDSEGPSGETELGRVDYPRVDP
jgi:hypothetical protein